ncbi:MAG: thioesterase family protein [Terricaulis sp.]
MCALPEHATPRSIDMKRAPSDVSLARAKELGLARIGGHLVTPDQCDPFGRLRAEHVFGRVSDSIPNLISQWRQKLAKDAAKQGSAPIEPAGAVVEARVVFRRWPRAGDLIEVYSGVAEVGAKTNRLVHWLVDPVSGAGWASIEGVALTFDIATRKTIAPSPEALASMRARVIAGLAV